MRTKSIYAETTNSELFPIMLPCFKFQQKLYDKGGSLSIIAYSHPTEIQLCLEITS
jgi:hypothetical protein